MNSIMLIISIVLQSDVWKLTSILTDQ